MGSILDVPGITIGHAQDDTALTGCTAVLFSAMTAASVDVRGSAPGTKETDLLQPTSRAPGVDAIVLTGGSTFGLDAASGVMKYLEERGIGAQFAGVTIPLVPAAVIFDLLVGDGRVRPDARMGYEAAQRASADGPARGRIGAGRGATAAKLGGRERATDAGIGSASLRNGDLVVGALAVCNALGSVYDRRTGERLCGPRADDGSFLDDTELLRDFFAPPGTNTTIGIVATNALITKTQAKKMAEIAHDGLARAVHPVHTMLDGDTIFAVSTSNVEAPFDLVLALAADAFSDAVADAIRSVTP